MDIYKELVYWELRLQKSDSPEMQEVFQARRVKPIPSSLNLFQEIMHPG